MDRPLSPNDLHGVMRQADAAARRLQCRLRLPAADIDDLRQDLLLDCLTRWPAFDATRGSVGAFAALVIRHRATRIADSLVRQRRRSAGVPISLDAPIRGIAGATIADGLVEADGLAAWHGQKPDPFDRVDRRLDVERVVAAADPSDAMLCAALSRRSIDQLVARRFGARTTLYRRIRDLRMTFAARGLHPRWDVFRGGVSRG